MWQTGSAARGVDDLETGEELLVLGGRNKQDVEGTTTVRACVLTLPRCCLLLFLPYSLQDMAPGHQ